MHYQFVTNFFINLWKRISWSRDYKFIHSARICTICNRYAGFLLRMSLYTQYWQWPMPYVSRAKGPGDFHLPIIIIITFQCVSGSTGLLRAETLVRVAGVLSKKLMTMEPARVPFGHSFFSDHDDTRTRQICFLSAVSIPPTLQNPRKVSSEIRTTTAYGSYGAAAQEGWFAAYHILVSKTKIRRKVSISVTPSPNSSA